MELNERILDLGEKIVKNEVGRIDLIRKQRRYDMLRLRRSELGKKMFGKSQKAILKATFLHLERLWRWKKNVRSGFELHHAVIKQDMDMSRMRVERDSAVARDINKIDNYNVHRDLSLKSIQLPLVPESLAKLPETLMYKFGYVSFAPFLVVN